MSIGTFLLFFFNIKYCFRFGVTQIKINLKYMECSKFGDSIYSLSFFPRDIYYTQHNILINIHNGWMNTITILLYLHQHM